MMKKVTALNAQQHPKHGVMCSVITTLLTPRGNTRSTHSQNRKISNSHQSCDLDNWSRSPKLTRTYKAWYSDTEFQRSCLNCIRNHAKVKIFVDAGYMCVDRWMKHYLHSQVHLWTLDLKELVKSPQLLVFIFPMSIQPFNPTKII